VGLEVAEQARVVLEVEQARTHPEQVLHGEPVGVRDRQVGQQVLHQITEREATLADQLEDHDRGEGLGGAPDPVVRLRCHDGAGGEVGHARRAETRRAVGVLDVDEGAREATLDHAVELGLNPVLHYLPPTIGGTGGA
jgi:hypothetical protein